MLMLFYCKAITKFVRSYITTLNLKYCWIEVEFAKPFPHPRQKYIHRKAARHNKNTPNRPLDNGSFIQWFILFSLYRLSPSRESIPSIVIITTPFIVHFGIHTHTHKSALKANSVSLLLWRSIEFDFFTNTFRFHEFGAGNGLTIGYYSIIQFRFHPKQETWLVSAKCIRRRSDAIAQTHPLL